MDYQTNIKISFHALVHNKKHTIDECADEVTRSSNYLYRLASLTEDLPLPVEIATRLMKFNKDYSLLQTIANECGYTIAKLPRPACKKGDENDIASDYQEAATRAVSNLIKFLKVPSPENYTECSNSLKEIVRESISVEKYVDKKQSKQIEMELK